MASKNYYPEYVAQYKREHVDRVPFEVPKGKKQLLKETAAQHNLSVNRMITDALETQYKIDLSKK